MFRAYDATRERLVAVKLFKLDLPPERVHQLVAELERLVAARLDYPSLVAPVGTGIVGVAAYLAQDYVAAESLDLAVREYGPAPPADAVRVAAQLAGALDFAATVRIAHGALHPRDVLLSSEETRLTGVGVAHALERVGVTPPVRRPYSAPERIAGSEWDRRADVFSLAALMHELMWGRRPTGIGGQAADSLTEIAGGDLPALRDAFARALAENPADRFETALEFVEALNAAFPNVRLVVPDPQSAVRNPQSRAARAEEPRLPLDGDQDRTLVAPAAEVAAAVRHAVPHVEPVEPVDLPIAAIDAAEEERYRDADVAPAIVDPPFETVIPQSAIRNPQLFESAFEPSRSAVWPLVLAVGLGLAVGFAGGYGVGTHSRPDSTAVAVAPTAASRTPDAAPTPAATTAAPPAPAASGREFTENAVAPAPKPAAPAPQSAIANPQSAIASPQSAIRNPQSESNPGRLLVRSTPAGARVAIDGRDVGRTPVAARDLAHGPHHVRVTRDGYAAAERRIVITPARPAQAMTFALARPSVPPGAAAATPGTAGRFAGTLIVDSRPAGAKVYVDGKLAGTTPMSMPDVRAGEHAVRIERDGYRRWSSSVRVVAAEQNKVTASLER